MPNINYLYIERQKTYLLVVMVFIIVAGFLLALVLWPRQEFSQLTKIVLFIAAVVDLILFWSFSQLTIKISKEYLQISFGVFKKKISFSEINDVLVQDFDFKNYFGYGIRLGKDKSIGYVARGGRGIKLKLSAKGRSASPKLELGTRAGGKDYFFTSENPEQIQNIIRQKISEKYDK